MPVSSGAGIKELIMSSPEGRVATRNVTAVIRSCHAARQQDGSSQVSQGAYC